MLKSQVKMLTVLNNGGPPPVSRHFYISSPVQKTLLLYEYTFNQNVIQVPPFFFF